MRVIHSNVFYHISIIDYVILYCICKLKHLHYADADDLHLTIEIILILQFCNLWLCLVFRI